MGLFLIYLAFNIGGVDMLDYLKPGAKYPTFNENPQFALIKPMENSCTIVKDTSDSFFKNDKMVCNKG